MSAGTKLQASQLANSGAALNELGKTPGMPSKVMTGTGGLTIKTRAETAGDWELMGLAERPNFIPNETHCLG
jgi:hypothetical protein